MKLFILTLFILSMISTSAFASFSARTCSNASGTIVINNGVVKIVTQKAGHASQSDEVQSFKSGVDVQVEQELTVVETRSTCSRTTTISMAKTKLTRLNSLEGMPSAYSVGASNDGTLSDTLICESWMTWVDGCL
jgi:hypothetical protein